MTRILASIVLIALGACSAETDPLAERRAIETAAPSGEPVANVAAATPAGFDPVPPAEVARLTGELRCSFADARDRVLFIGAANVGRSEPAEALVGASGGAVLLRREVSGGFAALQRGGSFAGGGVRATVTLGEEEATGNEGSAHRATLTLVPTGEAPRTTAGRWSCGP